MSTRRPLTEAEKQLRREKSKAFWSSPEAAELREKARLRRIEYNKTKVDERLSAEARKASGERINAVTKARVFSEQERRNISERITQRNMDGKQKRHGPMPEDEREMHRQRMLGNRLGAGHQMSAEARAAASRRMTERNPMKKPEAAAKMRRTLTEHHGADYTSKMFKQLWAEGRIKGHPLSDKARALSSDRMKAANPMKDAAIAEKARLNYTDERKAAAAKRMRQTWEEGKITPAMFSGKGNVKGANKTEQKLFPMLRYYHGRFVGDGTFWLAETASGIRRNPDFIFGNGKDKTALLVHGVFWHRDQTAADLEMTDYMTAGWSLFVLWTKRIQKWMMPEIKGQVRSWLAEIESSPLRTPVLRQFMTWNAGRTTTS